MPGFDYPKSSGQTQFFSDDRGDAVLIPHPVIGVVKDNIDPGRTGRIRVYIAAYCGNDPDASGSWIPADYLSPWFGVSSPNYNIGGNPGSPDYGDYVGNPHSYGFWATAPDIGSQVLCVFVNGRPDQGYYVGCVPPQGLTHMVPAMGSAQSVVPNAAEAKSYGGATRLPVTEVNYNNPGIANSPTIADEPRPVHSYQASILFEQGLIRDSERGTIGSSSQRETPSRVFGWSTPGGPIYQGGYTSRTIDQAIQAGVDPSKLQVVGRTGGHSVVMDDGDLQGQDQLIRIRTSAGHMIMMNDTAQSLTLLHSNGLSWVELGREGTIDMYATNSVNIRTKGDLNLHADRDVNMHAGGALRQFGVLMQQEAETMMTQRAGQQIQQYAGTGYNMKSDGAVSMMSTGSTTIQSVGAMNLVGLPIKLNSGVGSPPREVPELSKTRHTESVFNRERGWINPGPKPLISITTRAPTHWPYAAAGTGVAITENPNAPDSTVPSASVLQALGRSLGIPQNPISQAVASTVQALAPVMAGGQVVVPGEVAATMAAQNAASLSDLSTDQAAASGYVPGSSLGITLDQAASAGQATLIKPGAAEFIQSRAAAGQPWLLAANGPVYTGWAGVNTAQDLSTNLSAQTDVAQASFQASADRLADAGVITGNESATQVAGVINREAVEPLIQLGGPQDLAGQSVSAGSWAAGLWDGARSGVTDLGANITAGVQGLGEKISGGISGIGTSISGGIEGLRSGFSGLASGGSGGLGSLFSQGTSGGIITGSIGSVATSVGGLVSALGGLFGGGKTTTIQSIQAQQQSATQRAYEAELQRYIELQANQPNVLGGGDVISSADRTQSALEMYAVSDQRLSVAEQELRIAEDNYKASPTALNRERLELALQSYQSAVQLQQTVANSVMTGVTPAQSASLAQGRSRGLDVTGFLVKFLGAYGGVEGLIAKTRFGQSFIPRLQQTVSSINSRIQGVTQIVNVLSNPALMANNVINKLSTNLSNVAGNYLDNQIQKLGGKNAGTVREILNTVGISTAPGAFMGSIRGLLGSVGGVVRNPSVATETFSYASIKARVTQLLGDNRVPTPNFSSSPVIESNDEILKQQSALVKQITALQQTVQEQNRQISQLLGEIPQSADRERNYAGIRALQTQQRETLQKISEAEEQLVALQTAK